MKKYKNNFQYLLYLSLKLLIFAILCLKLKLIFSYFLKMCSFKALFSDLTPKLKFYYLLFEIGVLQSGSFDFII